MTDERVEAVFARAGRWQQEMAALRAILRDAGLEECFKWRGPCYTHSGGNVAFLIMLKDCVSLGFFKGVMLPDPEGILAPPGENSRIARAFKAVSLAEIAAAAPALKAILAAAMRMEEEGVKVEVPEAAPDLPGELVRALEGDAELARAFAALTPGRQRGWSLYIGQPKQAATRVARIAKARPRILAGKGMHDR